MIAASVPPLPSPFDWGEAFSRNRGLLDRGEQQRLRESCVAIAGAGGVGGSHALTLARQGVGKFRIADPDTFALANLNRQAGARLSSLGRNKAEEIAAQIHEINPEAEVHVMRCAIDATTIDELLDGADVVLDGIDFFAIDARRLLFQRAKERGLWALTAGPMGFSYALLAFDPAGMSFDRYCGLGAHQSFEERLLAFLAALAPRATHAAYTDFSAVDVTAGTGPSSVIACQLCSSVIALETVALLVGRRRPRAAPAFTQFDPYRQVFRRGRIWFGGANPWQRFKRRVIRRRLRALGVLP